MDDSTLDIAALEGLADTDAAKALQGTLSGLEKETELLLFVGAGCAVCPHQVRSAATVALASPNVVLEVVDAAQEPELAAQYEVRKVPTTVIDDELILVGVVRPDELALRLVERQGPEEAKRVFLALLRAGHTTAAAERLADGRAADAYVELWKQSGPDQRLILLEVAGESLLFDPFGLGRLVPDLAAALGDEPIASDPAHRADTAELLGRSAAEEARPPLERLTEESDRVVAKAAGEALAELDD